MSLDVQTPPQEAGASVELSKKTSTSGTSFPHRDMSSLSRKFLAEESQTNGNNGHPVCGSCHKNSVAISEKKFNLPSGARLIVENLCLECVDGFEEKVKCLEKAAGT
jgi:hypothetical protein